MLYMCDAIAVSIDYIFAVASCPGQGGYDAGYLYRCSMEGASSENEPYEAPHTVPVPPVGGLDIPLHALTFRYELSHCMPSTLFASIYMTLYMYM